MTTMAANSIPAEIQRQAQNVIEHFNNKKIMVNSKYVPRFKGAFLYLDREDYGSSPSEICRLKYIGSLDKWEFAIFKHSSNRYDPDECMFPGTKHLNGSIEGAMLCGMEAYHA
jgi:hypothetical protein